MKSFPIIKQKAFTFGEGEKKQSGVSYSVGYKGRNIQVSTLNFEKDELKEVDGQLQVNCDVELVKGSFESPTGETINTVRLMPMMDLKIATI